MATAVHEAAVGTDGWPDALDLIRTTMGAVGSAVISGGDERTVQSCVDPDAMAAYHQHFHRLDYVLDAVETGPTGMVHTGAALVALNPRSEFNGDWMRPYKMDDGLFVKLGNGSHPTTFLVAAPRRGDPYATAERVRAVNALVPHLQQALRTHRTLGELRERTARYLHPVDSLLTPAAVVAPDGTYLRGNQSLETMLRTGTTVCVRSRRLHVVSPTVDTALHRAVAHAAAGGGLRCGESLLLPRAAGRPLVIHVSPFRDGGPPCALLVFVDPGARREPARELLAELFGLTRAEAEVAQHLARGQCPAAIAAELSLSAATIKSHMQRVYDKTDTHRQAELVRLLMAITP